jgi:hypothetical protein
MVNICCDMIVFHGHNKVADEKEYLRDIQQ